MNFDFEGERRRMKRLIKKHGLECIEDHLLATGIALLDLAEERPEHRRSYSKIHTTVSMKRCVVCEEWTSCNVRIGAFYKAYAICWTCASPENILKVHTTPKNKE